MTIPREIGYNGRSMEKNDIYDVIIIGGGPAGASAALYAARGGVSVAVLTDGRSALHKAESIQNFYGTGAVSGDKLYLTGIEQAQSVGAEVIESQVTFASFDGNEFRVDCPERTLKAKRLVIATGAERRTARLSGLKELDGKGVSYCAVCDAFFYRKRKVGVLGAGEFAEHEYNALKSVVGEVVLLTDGQEPCFPAENVDTRKLKRVVEKDGRVGGVEFEDGDVLELSGLFVALGTLGSNALCKSLGVFTEADGSIKVDANGMTNIKGLYAAGDCTLGIKQVAKAVADGMKVGLSLIADLRGTTK